MAVVRRIRVGVVGAVLAIAMAACGPAAAMKAPVASSSQTLQVPATQAPQHSGGMVWGRVPYCNCLAGAATANVASALEEANVSASVKESSPRDGWLYFAVTFDPHATTPEQVGAAIVAGGGQLLESPP